MHVRLLGPIEVAVDGQVRPVHGVRRRTVLAVLALHAGEVVSKDRLIDTLWGEIATASALVTLQSHISQLRRALGPSATIRSLPPGYVLDLSVDGTDVQAASRLIQTGIESTDPVRAIAVLNEAIALWRGSPLVDIVESVWCTDHMQRLDALLLQARLALIDRRLTLGEHTRLLPELDSLSRRHPLDEHIHGQLMLALYRAGRQADALATFDRLRHTLHDDLGITPQAKLSDLHQAILRQDPILDLAARLEIREAPAAGGVVPAQLPGAVPSFTGRVHELDQLNALLSRGTDSPATMLAVVSGTAGVGKTALAVHWAHLVAARFPDGQLYMNLRGFDPARPPMPPAEAVRSCLEALGVPVFRIPADPDGQAALYRSVLAGKRVLVILDNARDAEQIRPLLPGAPGCLVVATSRDQLAGLIANEGAHCVELDLMSAEEARRMVTQRLGSERVAAEPEAVDQFIDACARLPLALAVATAQASSHPRFRLAAIAGALNRAPDALDAFRSGDPASDVRNVLSWSYRALGTEAAQVFRLLGLHPGHDIAVPAVASLAGIPLSRALTVLAELTQAHLLTEYPPGRYAFHDLLRAYARELVHEHDSGQERDDAMRRLLDHYLHSAHAAAQVCFGPWVQVPLGPAKPDVSVERPESEQEAMAWLNAQRRVMLAAFDHAGVHLPDGYAWRLAWVLTSYLRHQQQLLDWAAIQRIALDTAERDGDPLGLAYAHHGLGRVYTWMGQHDEAHSHLREALDRFARLGDAVGLGQVHLNIGALWHKRRDYTEALRQATQALVLFQSARHPTGQAEALSGIGWCHAQLGDYHRALTVCQHALELHQAAGDRLAQADTWDSLGYAHHGLGNRAEAIFCYTTATDLYRDLGDRYHQADTLTRLGETHAAYSDNDEARTAWQQALAILDSLDHPDAARVRDRLASTA